MCSERYHDLTQYLARQTRLERRLRERDADARTLAKQLAAVRELAERSSRESKSAKAALVRAALYTI